MVDAAASVEWIVASGEVDALMLEFNLIQQYLPRFNIRYRDDKSYPYLALTVGEKWPRAQVLRGTKRKKVRYFGPVRARLGDPGHAGCDDAGLPDPDLHQPLLRPAGASGTTVPLLRHRPLLGAVRARADGDHRGGVSTRRGGARGLPGRELETRPEAARRADGRGVRARGVRAGGAVPRPAAGSAPGAREPGDGPGPPRGPGRGGPRRGRPRGCVPGVHGSRREGPGTEGLGRRSRRGPRPPRARGVVPPPGLHGARGRAAAHPGPDRARRSRGP